MFEEKTYRPLADELRPRTLDDVVGQSHILGKGGLLRRIIESGKIPNMIFYGPSGTGKTTDALKSLMRLPPRRSPSSGKEKRPSSPLPSFKRVSSSP